MTRVKLNLAPLFLTTHSPEIVKRLKFENILLVTDDTPKRLSRVQQNELPYPSLNEVNFAAFGEATYEYHNELYGYIEAENRLNEYRSGKQLRAYKQLRRDGSTEQRQIVLTEYVRHQIHHPENLHNERFTSQELVESIQAMRDFIKA